MAPVKETYALNERITAIPLSSLAGIFDREAEEGQQAYDNKMEGRESGAWEIESGA